MRKSHLSSSFRKSREPAAKLTLTRIQRRARDLMSLASVLVFFTVIAWLLIALGLWQASGVGATASSSMPRLLKHWHMMPKQPLDLPMIALACLLAFVAALAPLVCLRSLGKALYSQPPLSFIVAGRFAWLGHALVINIVVGFAAGLIAASEIKDYQLTFSLGSLGTLIAAVLAYVVAEMVREGARAAKENREFV
ncbi:MAG TPA: hypothetical protein VGN24_02740 [Rhodanobacter sp.]|jgi:hypothetical protein|nr:hypothetical protein [Rhodanobacter sp.]